MQITLTLPDNSTRSYDAGVSGMEVAASIGAGLAKAAVAVTLNDKQQDLSEPVSYTHLTLPTILRV